MADDNDGQATELIAAAERALAPVLADLERTCEIRASIRVMSEDGDLRVWVSDEGSYGWSSQPIDEDPEVAKAEMADYVQEQLMDVGVEHFWPSCTEHNRGLHARLHQGRAMCFCRGGEHTIADVGHLGES